MVQCMVVCSEVHGEMYGGVHDISLKLREQFVAAFNCRRFYREGTFPCLDKNGDHYRREMRLYFRFLNLLRWPNTQ